MYFAQTRAYFGVDARKHSTPGNATETVEETDVSIINRRTSLSTRTEEKQVKIICFVTFEEEEKDNHR